MPNVLPILPLRDVIMYPNMVFPLFVGRERSVRALDQAIASEDKLICLVAQRDPHVETPQAADLYTVGTVCTILQLLKLPDGTIKALVEGLHRGAIEQWLEGDDHMAGVITQLDHQLALESEAASATLDVLVRSLLSQFEQYIKLNRKIPFEILSTLSEVQDPGRLCDTIAAHMPLKLSDKQCLLETTLLTDRIERLMVHIESEIQVLEVGQNIRSRVQQQMDSAHRKYILQEQIKAAHQELGDLEGASGETDSLLNESASLAQKIEAAGMPKEAKEKALSELSKFKLMSPMSPEATVSRSYMENLLQFPWKHQTRLKYDLNWARHQLDQDHDGLDKVKERVLEYLAVQQRVRSPKGAVLCLVGPPGVGKTSLGESIARATGRRFVRMSLGGVRDEAEIRGHRRTYIGAMPGKIVQKMSRVGVKNPLFLLDEIDKMAMDFRGDPGSALLEVLDPAQNHAFGDHYLEVGCDLSRVMFVVTANSLHIPAPLLDRLEVIRLSGYTEHEKLRIAQRHVLPAQLKQHGLRPHELRITTPAVRDIIRRYTREAGVRGLERCLAKIARKVVKALVLQPSKQSMVVKKSDLFHYLGVPPYQYGRAQDHDRVGQVCGLAWTEAGGELLTVEAVSMPGRGRILHTGHLGDVMKESVQAAWAVVRSKASLWRLDPAFYSNQDVHVHMPEGATPKDGPSAGIAMCVAIVSALSGVPARADVAMTGEITLRGEVLAIGGLKEKLLAAHRAGIRKVLIPEDNRKDLDNIPASVLKALDVRSVRWIGEVLNHALRDSVGVVSDARPRPTQESGPAVALPYPRVSLDTRSFNLL